MIAAPDSPTLSVVIPVQRDLSGLRKTVESLWNLNQTGKWIEIIIADGGACQETAAWLLQHQDEIDHIRSAPDQGIYDAMNLGVSCANAPWTWICGAGDIPNESVWSEKRAQIPTWEEEKLQIFQVNLDENRESGVPASYPARWDNTLTWRNTTHHQGILYPTALIRQNPFDLRFPVLADYFLHLRLFHRGINAQLHAEIWAHVASGGVSRQFVAALYVEEWRMKRKVLSGWQRAVQPAWLALKFCFKKFKKA